MGYFTKIKYHKILLTAENKAMTNIGVNIKTGLKISAEIIKFVFWRMNYSSYSLRLQNVLKKTEEISNIRI